MTEPRKASDILLELEKKLDIALSIIRAQDLNIKILSNKLNAISEKLEKPLDETPKFMVEAVTSDKKSLQPIPVQDNQFFVSNEDSLPLEMEPKGFRRTSRPETFAGDDSYFTPKIDGSKFSVKNSQTSSDRSGSPPPGRGPAEVIVQQPIKQKKSKEDSFIEDKKVNNSVLVQNAIPVTQRVTNAHGKSLFLADVEIIDISTMQTVNKTRTNGTGKWIASLGVGKYRVIIRKLEAATKERLELTQEIYVDGSQSPFELQTVVVKA